MWYAEIDENGKCFALSDMAENDIPTLIKLDEYRDVLGWTWDGENWIAPEPEPEPEPRPLTDIELSIFNTEINTEYLVCMSDLGL